MQQRVWPHVQGWGVHRAFGAAVWRDARWSTVPARSARSANADVLTRDRRRSPPTHIAHK
eukprot:15015243-Alexandrium_andersonii.AAC.1